MNRVVVLLLAIRQSIFINIYKYFKAPIHSQIIYTAHMVAGEWKFVYQNGSKYALGRESNACDISVY